jgi:hypothetical protein
MVPRPPPSITNKLNKIVTSRRPFSRGYYYVVDAERNTWLAEIVNRRNRDLWCEQKERQREREHKTPGREIRAKVYSVHDFSSFPCPFPRFCSLNDYRQKQIQRVRKTVFAQSHKEGWPKRRQYVLNEADCDDARLIVSSSCCWSWDGWT